MDSQNWLSKKALQMSSPNWDLFAGSLVEVWWKSGWSLVEVWLKSGWSLVVVHWESARSPCWEPTREINDLATFVLFQELLQPKTVIFTTCQIAIFPNPMIIIFTIILIIIFTTILRSSIVIINYSTTNGSALPMTVLGNWDTMNDCNLIVNWS